VSRSARGRSIGSEPTLGEERGGSIDGSLRLGWAWAFDALVVPGAGVGVGSDFGAPSSNAAGLAKRSDNFRTVDGTSSLGKRAARNSLALRTDMSDTPANNSSTLPALRCGLSNASTLSESFPAANGGNSAGKRRARRAASMRRHASSSLKPRRSTQNSNIDPHAASRCSRRSSTSPRYAMSSPVDRRTSFTIRSSPNDISWLDRCPSCQN